MLLVYAVVGLSKLSLGERVPRRCHGEPMPTVEDRNKVLHSVVSTRQRIEGFLKLKCVADLLRYVRSFTNNFTVYVDIDL